MLGYDDHLMIRACLDTAVVAFRKVYQGPSTRELIIIHSTCTLAYLSTVGMHVAVLGSAGSERAYLTSLQLAAQQSQF